MMNEQMPSQMVEADLVIVAEKLAFPEGPVVMEDGDIALVEVEGRRISRVDKDGRVATIAEVSGGPNGLALGPDGQLFLCNSGGFAFRSEGAFRRPAGQSEDYRTGTIEIIDPRTGEAVVLYDRVGENLLKGPNDLMFDRQEGFWFSDLGKVRTRDRDHGGLYWAAADGSQIIEAAYPIIGGANGVGLSPDGKIVYAAETETGRLWAWEIVGTGTLRKHPWPSPHGGRLVCQMPGFRRLDSLAMTASGNIVVGTLVTGEITTVSPEGVIVDVKRMPDLMTTNICFGGEDMTTAWITLSGTGRLARMKWSEPGLKLAY